MRHGLTPLRDAMRAHGTRVLDPRSPVARALRAWQATLVADLGGAGHLTTQQMTLVEIAARAKLMLDSIDTWLLSQATLVFARRRTVYPIVRERTALAAHLAQLLGQLGLERQAPKALTFHEYLAAHPPAADPHADPGANTARPAPPGHA
jgi:hypothetical protein